ncbi:hypothetical protein [Cupriavidus pauculus]|uniref:hypothetical protein n=1 Tax=Cupriavidus pauculus TaxID=82633 RepID=UPI001EE24823|nr:hypothetical protein [Cupriavidus pauculus]GJG96462.1 hypothetical protein CBA19C6_18255 [Cupriavidus pauculus]
MGGIAMFGAFAWFWFTGARRAALVVAGIMVLGIVVFLTNNDGRTCGDRTWFCDVMPGALMALRVSPRCQDADDQVKTRIFTEERVDAEVRRLVSTGVCQFEAIARLHTGWGAQFAPEYLARYGNRKK